VQHIIEADLRKNGARVSAADIGRNRETKATKTPLGAELIVSGTSAVDFDRSIQVEGMPFYFYRGSFTAEIVRSSTQEILGSMKISPGDNLDLSAMSKEEARHRLLEQIGMEAAAELLGKFGAYWEQTASTGDAFDLVVNAESQASLSNLETFLRSDARVRSLKRRRLQDMSGRYDLLFAGSQNALLELIMAHSGKPCLLEEVDHQLTIALDRR
jgi:hypothetical protein